MTGIDHDRQVRHGLEALGDSALAHLSQKPSDMVQESTNRTSSPRRTGLLLVAASVLAGVSVAAAGWFAYETNRETTAVSTLGAPVERPEGLAEDGLAASRPMSLPTGYPRVASSDGFELPDTRGGPGTNVELVAAGANFVLATERNDRQTLVDASRSYVLDTRTGSWLALDVGSEPESLKLVARDVVAVATSDTFVIAGPAATGEGRSDGEWLYIAWSVDGSLLSAGTIDLPATLRRPQLRATIDDRRHLVIAGTIGARDARTTNLWRLDLTDGTLSAPIESPIALESLNGLSVVGTTSSLLGSVYDADLGRLTAPQVVELEIDGSATTAAQTPLASGASSLVAIDDRHIVMVDYVGNTALYDRTSREVSAIDRASADCEDDPAVGNAGGLVISVSRCGPLQLQGLTGELQWTDIAATIQPPLDGPILHGGEVFFAENLIVVPISEKTDGGFTTAYRALSLDSAS